MSTLRVLRGYPPPHAMGERALSDLRFIRSAMERSGQFTAVPGWGGVWMGTIALVAAGIASLQSFPGGWLATWLAAAPLASVLGIVAATRKSRAQEPRALARPGRKFLLCFCPPLLTGAVLTVVLARAGLYAFLPGVWMLHYGAGTLAAGVCSPRIVPVTGAVFMLLGAATLLCPPAWGNVMLAIGFGGVHIASGLVIARRYGG